MKNLGIKSKTICILLLICGWHVIATAQTPVLEKMYEVSNKVNRGFLESIEINKENGNIEMAYVLPNALTTKRDAFLGITRANMSGKVKYEIFTYDKDLNLVGTAKEEERLYKSEWPEYSYTTVEPTIKLGCLCLGFKQVEVTASYNWYSGYKKISKDVGKTKAQSDDGSNYSFTGMYYDLFAEKSILTLAGKKVKKALWNQYMHYDILHVDNESNVKVTTSFDFEVGNNVIFSAPLKDKRKASNYEFARDWIIVFAPMPGSKGKTTEFTYLRINPKGNIVEKITFNSPVNGWYIEGAYEENGAVFLYGSAISKDPTKKYYADVVNKGWNELTFTHFQLAKISKEKVDYVNATPLSEISSKQAIPSNQKKPVGIDGKTYETTGIRFLSSGDILFTYQDYEIKDGEKHVAGGTYKSVYLFQFSALGVFKKSYGVDINPDVKNMEKVSRNIWEHLPADHYFYPSADGKRMYWLIRSAKDVAIFGSASAEHNDLATKPLNGIDYGSVDFESQEISAFKSFGENEKKPFFLFNNTSFYPLNNYLYIFNETEKGDKILLNRIDISK